jgi:transcriptional regulator EpsA
MPHPAYHTTDHGDALLRAVEAASQVRSRQQLFLWLRLHLHRFVPHDVLLCLPGRQGGGGLPLAQVFNSVPLPDAAVQALEQPESLFWQAVQQAWVHAGRQAAEVPLASLPACEQVSGLMQAGFAVITVDGVDLSSGMSPSLLLVFAQTAAGDPSWRAAGLQLCLPQIYFALLRVQSATLGAVMPAPSATVVSPLLTGRELEVLRAVRAARGNLEIGEQLGISALTVKNHLRKIMRKLGARNRVQAVAEAMARHLIE